VFVKPASGHAGRKLTRDKFDELKLVGAQGYRDDLLAPSVGRSMSVGVTAQLVADAPLHRSDRTGWCTSSRFRHGPIAAMPAARSDPAMRDNAAM
jgi:hypothetical protein